MCTCGHSVTLRLLHDSPSAVATQEVILGPAAISPCDSIFSSHIFATLTLISSLLHVGARVLIEGYSFLPADSELRVLGQFLLKYPKSPHAKHSPIALFFGVNNNGHFGK